MASDTCHSLNEASTDLSPAFVIALLHDKGLSLRRLALSKGYRPRTLSNALYRDYPRAERLIAKALGKRPEDLWPARIAARRQRHKRTKTRS
jgi:Ner family transcriptional regulator